MCKGIGALSRIRARELPGRALGPSELVFLLFYCVAMVFTMFLEAPGPSELVFLLFYCVAMVFTMFLEGLLKSSIGRVAGRLAEVV